MSENELEEFM